MKPRTFRSLKDWSSDTFSKMANRIVIFVRPRCQLVSMMVGQSERLLAPVDLLNVTFASFEGRRIPGREPKLARSYWLSMYDSRGRLYFGGASKKGCRNCKFLGRRNESRPADGYRNVPDRLLRLLKDLQVETLSAEVAAGVMPEPVVRISVATDVHIDDVSMATYIRKLWLRDCIRKDTDTDGEEGLAIDFSDIGADEVIILPEQVGRAGQFKYSLDLSSPERLREGLGEELFQTISKAAQRMFQYTELMPLELIRKGQRLRFRDTTYWDLTRYLEASRKQAETIEVEEGEDEQRLKEEHESFLVVSYVKRDVLRFSTQAAVFDFSQNHYKSLHDNTLKQRAEERREEWRKARAQAREQTASPQEKAQAADSQDRVLAVEPQDKEPAPVLGPNPEPVTD